MKFCVSPVLVCSCSVWNTTHNYALMKKEFFLLFKKKKIQVAVHLQVY